jgi:hypothetical protein
MHSPHSRKLAMRASWHEVNYRHQGYKIFLADRKQKPKNRSFVSAFVLDYSEKRWLYLILMIGDFAYNEFDVKQ